MRAELEQLRQEGFWTPWVKNIRGTNHNGFIATNRTMLERLVLIALPYASLPPPMPITTFQRPTHLQLPPSCDGPAWAGLRKVPLTIVDVFPFGWELDLLEIRLFELEHVVDKFVVWESGFSDRGVAKPLFFASNVARFARFRHKILHVVQDDATYLSNAKRRAAAAKRTSNAGSDWTNAVENNREEIISRYYASIGNSDVMRDGRVDPNTLFLVGDVDELAAAEVIAELKYCMPREGHRHTRAWWPSKNPQKETPRKSVIAPLRVPLIPYSFDVEHVAPWSGAQRLQSPHHVSVLNAPAKQAMRYSNYPYFAGAVPPVVNETAEPAAALPGRLLQFAARRGARRAAANGRPIGDAVPESGVHFGRCLSPVSLFLKTWLHPEASEWRPKDLVSLALDPLAWYEDEKRRWTVPRLANKIGAGSKWLPWFVRAHPGRFPYMFPSRFAPSTLEYYVRPAGAAAAGAAAAIAAPPPRQIPTLPATTTPVAETARPPVDAVRRRTGLFGRRPRNQVRKIVKRQQAAARQAQSAPPQFVRCPREGSSKHTPFHRPPRATGASRCVYVDIGANHADTIDDFMKGTHFRHPFAFPVSGPSPCPHQAGRANVDIYAVEANPMHDAVLVDRFCQRPQLRGLYNRTAMWNKTTPLSEGGIKFYLDLVNGNENTWPFAWSASLSPKGNDVKKSGMKHITVPTVDVCELLLREVGATPSNRVVVKIDIEDVDEVLLRRILAVPECLAVVDAVAYEDAARKPQKRSAESNEIERLLRAAGIQVLPWF